MKKIKKSKRSKKSLLILILLMGIGFASITTTLYVNGTANISNADFNIIFTKAVADGTDISEVAISQNGKQITYTTRDLNSVGDRSILYFIVKNNSPMYDGVVSINCTATGQKSEYYTVNSLIDGQATTTIEAMNTKDGALTVELSKTSTEPISEEFTCTINADAIERTTVGVEPELESGFHPIYYAYGLFPADEFPITSIEPPAGKTVYVAMDVERNIAACINRNGTEHCFDSKLSTIEYEKRHVQQVFSDASCEENTADGAIICTDGDFNCSVSAAEIVSCFNISNDSACNATPDSVYCP